LLAICGVLGQDFAEHGTYTEPTTGIIFYTSIETNGAITGDGELSTVSNGSYTFGMALPENAGTVDSTEYIGMIVGFSLTYILRGYQLSVIDWLDAWWS